MGTLDGKVRGLDPVKNGMIRWSVALSDEPLLSSSLNSVQVITRSVHEHHINTLIKLQYTIKYALLVLCCFKSQTILLIKGQSTGAQSVKDCIISRDINFLIGGR